MEEKKTKGGKGKGERKRKEREEGGAQGGGEMKMGKEKKKGEAGVLAKSCPCIQKAVTRGVGDGRGSS